MFTAWVSKVRWLVEHISVEVRVPRRKPRWVDGEEAAEAGVIPARAVVHHFADRVELAAREADKRRRRSAALASHGAETGVADVVKERAAGVGDIAHRLLLIGEQPVHLRAVLLRKHKVSPGAWEEELVCGARSADHHHQVGAVVDVLGGLRRRRAAAVRVGDDLDLPVEVVVAERLAGNQVARCVVRSHAHEAVAVVVGVVVDGARSLVRARRSVAFGVVAIGVGAVVEDAIGDIQDRAQAVAVAS